MHSSVYTGELMHNRLKPKKHRFSYRVASWLVDLDELDQLSEGQYFFSRNRFNVVAFYDDDYGNGSDQPLKTQIAQLLHEYDVAEPDNVRLLCYPRIFGYTFNPLAVYFCYKKGELIAVVYEVSNTFHERHSYVAPIDDSDLKSASTEISKKFVARSQADKQLHVSPFFPMNCYYYFRVKPPEEKVTLGITLNDSDGKLFSAVFTGLQQPINDRFIIKQILMLPFQTMKVITAIHWEALRLWVKGVSIFKHNSRGYFFSHSFSQRKATREKKI